MKIRGTDIRDLIIVLAAIFIWSGLIIAPFPRFLAVCMSSEKISADNKCQEAWNWIFGQTHITDWFLVAIGIFTIGVYMRQAAILEAQTNILKGQADLQPILQRAFIQGQSPIRALTNVPGRDIQIVIDLTFINIGNTASYQTTVWFNHELLPAELSEKFTFPRRINVAPSRPATFGPKQEMTCGPIVIERAETVKMGREKFKLYIWGCVNYKDVFDKDRFLAFCYQITSSSDFFSLTTTEQQDRLKRAPGAKNDIIRCIQYHMGNVTDEPEGSKNANAPQPGAHNTPL